MTKDEAARKPSRPRWGALDVSLFVVVVAVVLFLGRLLQTNLAFQQESYSSGIKASLAHTATVDHSAVLSYCRAQDFAIIKTSAVFMAFLVIFVGSLYVLRSIDASYALTVGKDSNSLITSSPGLVMITLGVVLIGVVLHYMTYVSYQAPALSTSSGSQLSRKEYIDIPLEYGSVQAPDDPNKPVNKLKGRP